jgi:hypothetical protein
MSAVVIDLRSVTRSLTRDERALVKSVPGVAERAVRGVCRAFDGNPRDPDLLRLAHLGIYQGALVHDPALGPFPRWAYCKAASAVMDGLKTDRRQRRMLVAARIASCIYLATRPRRPDEIDPGATERELYQGVVGFAQENIVASLVGATVAAEQPEGEDDLIEREAWAEAVKGLGGELGRLREDQRDLLTAYAHGRDLKSVAKGRGVSYSSLLEEWHALIAMLRARLGWLGVKSFPTPVRGDWPSVFPDFSDPDDKSAQR